MYPRHKPRKLTRKQRRRLEEFKLAESEANGFSKSRRPNRRRQDEEMFAEYHKEITSPKTYKPEPLNPLTQGQSEYLHSLRDDELPCVIVSGPAGTGKTYVAAAHFADELLAKKYEKMIITRPIQEAAEEGKIGFLPGDESQKTAPYFRPVKDVLEERLGKGRVDYLIEHGIIEFMPLELMRGTSLKNTCIIADEMQNCTKKQIELILTRVGEGSKISLDGDIRQTDIKQSGLQDCINRFQDSDYVDYIEFDESDIVRSGFCREVILRYRD